MTTSEQGRKMIETFEGLRLEAYQDQRGIWTIGYGHTGGITPNQTCTKEQAEAWLEVDLFVAENTIHHFVQIQIIQNEFDALVSLIYNIGPRHFADSHLLTHLNACNFRGAANEFLSWVVVNKQIDPGLLNRRKIEQELFLKVA